MPGRTTPPRLTASGRRRINITPVSAALAPPRSLLSTRHIVARALQQHSIDLNTPPPALAIGRSPPVDRQVPPSMPRSATINTLAGPAQFLPLTPPAPSVKVPDAVYHQIKLLQWEVQEVLTNQAHFATQLDSFKEMLDDMAEYLPLPRCEILKHPILPVGMARETKCGHVFCRSCIKGWLKRKETCPLCRAVVKLGDLRRVDGGIAERTESGSPGGRSTLDTQESAPVVEDSGAITNEQHLPGTQADPADTATIDDWPHSAADTEASDGHPRGRRNALPHNSWAPVHWNMSPSLPSSRGFRAGRMRVSGLLGEDNEADWPRDLFDVYPRAYD